MVGELLTEALALLTTHGPRRGQSDIGAWDGTKDPLTGRCKGFQVDTRLCLASALNAAAVRLGAEREVLDTVPGLLGFRSWLTMLQWNDGAKGPEVVLGRLARAAAGAAQDGDTTGQ